MNNFDLEALKRKHTGYPDGTVGKIECRTLLGLIEEVQKARATQAPATASDDALPVEVKYYPLTLTEAQIDAAIDAYDRTWCAADRGYSNKAAAIEAAIIAAHVSAAPQDGDTANASGDDRNLVTLDRRDLWDYVRWAIHSALNDKIPKDCVPSWAWEEATNRTFDIFRKFVDAAPVAANAQAPVALTDEQRRDIEFVLSLALPHTHDGEIAVVRLRALLAAPIASALPAKGGQS